MADGSRGGATVGRTHRPREDLMAVHLEPTAADTVPALDPRAFVERLFGAAVGCMDLLAIYLGDRLGLYPLLAERPHTAPELAAAAGIDERYAREWLEHGAVTGILLVDDAAAAPSERRF